MHVLTVGVDDCNFVSVDAEDVVRIARQVDESEAVAVGWVLGEISQSSGRRTTKYRLHGL